MASTAPNARMKLDTALQSAVNDKDLSSSRTPSDPSRIATSPLREEAFTTPPVLTRTSSGASGLVRTASFKFLDLNPPLGMWHASGSAASKAPSLAEVRQGSFSHAGWNAEAQRERRNSLLSRKSSTSGRIDSRPANSTANPIGPKTVQRSNTSPGGPDYQLKEMDEQGVPQTHLMSPIASADGESLVSKSQLSPNVTPLNSSTTKKEMQKDRISSDTDPSAANGSSTVSASAANYPNGYIPPPQHTWGQATAIGLKAFWQFFITPLGFLLIIYGLNVVAWGGMLFLLLCNAAPAMCHPKCNAINSPRRIWIEIDSQILNALFCVTGFGLIPWRFRDLYYLMRYRIMKDYDALRRLAGFNRSWFRLPGSEKLNPLLGAKTENGWYPDAMIDITDDVNELNNPSLPIPLKSTPDVPPTGERAPPTAPWKLDFVIWCYVWNTFLQAVLSGFMWHFNRINRPSWSTGLFVALACIVAAVGGIMVFIEGKKVKAIEGVAVTEEDRRVTAEQDVERAELRRKGDKDELKRLEKEEKEKAKLDKWKAKGFERAEKMEADGDIPSNLDTQSPEIVAAKP